jgi:RNA polymerase sigma factor (TIGR02999 family)
MMHKILDCIAEWRRRMTTVPGPERNPAEIGGIEFERIRVDEALTAVLYPELKRIAQSRMRRERSDHTLQATALINELYLRLLKNPDFVWKDRNHFLLSASQAMRNLLVDHARERKSGKRGGDWIRVDLTDAGTIAPYDAEQIVEVDQVLSELAKKEPRMAQVVELKFFSGMTFEEIGEVLGVDQRTAKRDWTLARVWLAERLGRPNNNERDGMGAD